MSFIFMVYDDRPIPQTIWFNTATKIILNRSDPLHKDPHFYLTGVAMVFNNGETIKIQIQFPFMQSAGVEINFPKRARYPN
jgi:hypothetical protein